MDKTQQQDIIRSYQHYESRFFRNHDQACDGFLYGEIGFCLAGFKPAVMIDFPTPLLKQYMDAVMHPWLAQWHGVLGVDWRVVQRRLTSPELPSAVAVFFLVHVSHPRLASSVGTNLLEEKCEQLDIVNEDDLAYILDYPGRLPRSLDDLEGMREVVYYNQESHLVLTTFAAQLDQQLHVQRHFESYKNAMTSLGIHLGLIFRRPAA